jgi:hypothetical protein
MEDGGYYALKGFDFQIDTTINAIFSSNSELDEVFIERIQDLNSDTFVTQVKYKETQDFSYAKIREPVVQLILESNSDITNRTYILYCYFRDRNESETTLKVTELETLLKIELGEKPSKTHIEKYNRIQSITNIMKESFVNRFKIVFAPNHQINFSRALKHISSQEFCNSETEANFYYCYIADLLRRLVIENKDPSTRSCTRKKLISEIKNKKSQFFYSSLEYFSGRENLLIFLKKQFEKPIKNQKTTIFFGKFNNSDNNLSNTIYRIIEQSFSRATYDIEPITFVVHESNTINIKKFLLKNNILFNDGYESIEFNLFLFNKQHISTRKGLGPKSRASDSLGEISFKARITSNLNFEKTIERHNYEPDKVYYFDYPKIDKYSEIPSFQVNGLNPDEIFQLFKK